MGLPQYSANLAAYNTDRFPSPSVWASFPIEEHHCWPGRYIIAAQIIPAAMTINSRYFMLNTIAQ